MTRQVTDNLYIDLEYFTPEEYYTYEAVAESAVSAAVSVSCDATKIAGGVVEEASGNLAIESTIAVSVTKFAGASSTMTVSSSIDATISHIHGADLFAFSNAALAADVAVIRDYNIASSATFSTAIDAVRGIYVSAQADAVALVNVLGLRSRAVEAAVDAAFSLAADANLTAISQVNITAQFVQTTVANVTQVAASSLISNFTQTAVGIKPTRVVGDPIITSGAGYSDLTIDTATKKFGAGSLRFHSRPSYVTNRSITVAGNTVVSTSQKKFGAGSIFFDGTGDNLSADFSSDFGFETGNFTIELWIYPETLVGTDFIFSFRNDASTAPVPILYLDNGILKYSNPNTVRITGSTLTANAWYHIALTRSGTSTRLFVNGTQVGSTYTDSSNYATGRPVFGSDYQNSVGSNFRGYMDDIHVSKGIARYTSNFTAPTQAITPDANSELLINGDTSITDSHADWQTVLDVPSVEYLDSDKWRTWKTIDFWLYIDPGHPTNNASYHHLIGQGLVGSSSYWSIMLQGRTGASRLFALSTNSGGPSGGAGTNDIADSQWHHNRFIYDSGSIAWFLNGTKVFTWTSVNLIDVAANLLIGGDSAYVGTRGTGNVYYDELLISDVALSNIGDTTITVPTSPYTNTADTSLLLHFDSNFEDDASQFPITFNAVAALVSTATLTANTIEIQGAAAALTASTALTSLVNRTVEANASLTSSATLVSSAERFRLAESTQASEFAQSVSVNLLADGLAALSSETTQTTDVNRTRDVSIATDAIAIQLTAAAKVGDYLITAESEFVQTTVAEKITDSQAVLSSSTLLSVDAIKAVDAAAEVNSATAVSALGNRIRFGQSDLLSSSEQTTAVNAVFDHSSNLAVQALLAAESTGTISLSADLVTTATQAADVVRFRFADSSLNSTATVSVTVSKFTGYQSTATSVSGLSIPGERIRPAAIATESIASQLTAVAKTGQGFITLEAPATLVADCSIIAENVITANISTELAAVAVKTVAVSSTLTTVSSSSIEGTTNITIDADLASEFALIADADRTGSAIALVMSAGTITATVGVIKQIQADLSVLAFELTVGERARGTTANLTSSTQLNAVIGGVFQLRSNMQGFASQLTVGKVIHITPQLTYVIPKETWVHTIQAEDREHSILAEDREYTIIG
jgi:hypothetical protein